MHGVRLRADVCRRSCEFCHAVVACVLSQFSLPVDNVDDTAMQ